MARSLTKSRVAPGGKYTLARPFPTLEVRIRAGVDLRRGAMLGHLASPGRSPLSLPAWILPTDETEIGCAMTRPTGPLSGGALNAALANELGKLIADFTGRGATRSRAIVHQDLVVCVFEEAATRAERNLVHAGKAELVRHQRDALQHAMSAQLIAAVENLTGRTVRTFMSGTNESGDSAVEAFVLDPETAVAAT